MMMDVLWSWIGRRVFASTMHKYVCFTKKNGDGWCEANLELCNVTSFASISVVSKAEYISGTQQCTPCDIQDTTPLQFNDTDLINSCNNTATCSLDAITAPSSNHGGILSLTYSCRTIATNPSSTVSNANSSGPNASSPGPNASSTGPTASSTGPNTSSTVPNASSTGPDADSTTAASLRNESTQAQFSTGSDDSFPTAIVVSVVVSVIIVVLVVAFLMYRKGQCKQLLGKCTKGHRKHSPDRSDELVMGSMANANLTYDLSSVVDVNNYNEDYSEIDKVDKENYFEYSQVNLKRKQPVHSLTYNHIGHFDRSSEDAEHTYNHVGDETSQKSDWSTLQPDTYSHVGAMARPASGHLAEDSYAHINGVVKDLPAAYETNQYDCAVFQFNGGQTGNSGHRGNEIKSGKENKFIVVGPSKVDMNSDAPVSHSYFVLEKHEKEA